MSQYVKVTGKPCPTLPMSLAPIQGQGDYTHYSGYAPKGVFRAWVPQEWTKAPVLHSTPLASWTTYQGKY